MKWTEALYRKEAISNGLLIAGLSGAALGIAFSVSRFGSNAGIIILCTLLGIGGGVLAFTRPKLGFYLCIFLGFVISTFERILYGILTLDWAIELLIAVVFAGIVVQKQVRREGILRNTAHPINYALILYLVYLIIGIFNPEANSVSGALFFMRKTINLIFIYLVSLELIQTYKDIRQFFYIWVLMAALCGAYACYQHWIGFPSFEMEWLYASEERIGLYKLPDGDFRKYSTLTDPAAFGVLMACSGVLVLALILESKSWKIRIRLMAATLFLLLGMAFSGTRTANFALIGGIAIYILLRINQIRTMVFALTCTMVLLFILFVPIYDNVTINRIRSTFEFEEDASYQVREINRNRIRPYVMSHPIGGGSLTTGDTGERFFPGHPLAGFPPDSGYMKTLLENGYVGLTLVCALYFVIMQQAVRLFYRVRKPFAKAFLLAAITSLFSTFLSQYSQIAIGASPGIYLFYGAIAVIVRISKLENSKSLQP